MENPNNYPAKLSIDYPDRELNKKTTFFRLFTVIPIALILWLLGGMPHKAYFAVYTSGILFFATVFMLLFRHKYPRWWFDWNLNITKFTFRVSAYFLLMTDVYPSTDEEQSVHIEIPYPDVKKELDPWLPLVKWILAIPHFIVLYILGFCAAVVSIFVWFVILFTGRYPKEIFEFIEGFFRWILRVMAYALLLTTDKYPPFSLK